MIADKIKNARTIKKLTQEQVAEDLQCFQRTLGIRKRTLKVKKRTFEINYLLFGYNFRKNNKSHF